MILFNHGLPLESFVTVVFHLATSLSLSEKLHPGDSETIG